MESHTCGLKALTCKYHGWTYLLDGSLRGVPKWDRVELFDRKDYGLVPVRVEVWEGLVFVQLDHDAPPLGSSLADVLARIGACRLAALRFAGRVSYPVEANWKVYVDNFLEGYHIPYVHPELMTWLDFQAYTTELAAGYSLQWSPLSAGQDNPYGHDGTGDALYYHIFPNLMLNVLPGRLQVNLVEALAPDRCVVHFDSYYDDLDSPAARQRIAEDRSASDKVQAEDAEICARVQQGLASRAYDRGRFSVECETGVHHFQQQLKAAYARWLSHPVG
jgi:choline monooxygenase